MNKSTKKKSILLWQTAILFLAMAVSVLGYIIGAAASENWAWGLHTNVIENFVISVIVTLVIARFSKEQLHKIAPIAMCVALIATLLLITPLGYESKWLDIMDIIVFSPSKFITWCYILFIGFIMEEEIPFIKIKLSFHKKLWLTTALVATFIFFFSEGYRIMGVLIVALGYVISCVYGDRRKHVITLCIIGCLFVLFIIGNIIVGLEFPQYATVGVNRVMAFFFPQQYMQSYAFQPMTAFMAIKSGGFFGKGFGEGRLVERLGGYFPNDFMVAALAENFGWISCLALIGIIVLLGYMLFRVFKLAGTSKNHSGQVIVLGVMMHLVFESVRNVLINLHVLPCSTTEFPFLYCDCNVVFLYAEIGLVLSVLYDCLRKQETSDQLEESEVQEENKKWSKIMAVNASDAKFFSNFVCGKENQVAYEICSTVVESDGNLYNPIYLHGDTGVGKTHLVSAMANSFRNNKKIVITVNCRDLQEAYVEYIRKRSSTDNAESFAEEVFKNYDVVVLEDSDLLRKNYITQIEFGHMINYLVAAKKQVVITSALPPEAMSLNIEKIDTYMSAKIEKPRLELKVHITDLKSKEEGVVLSEDELLHISCSSINGFQIEGKIKNLRLQKELDKNQCNDTDKKEETKGENVYEN